MSWCSTKWVILHFMLCLLFQALLPLWSICRPAVDSYVTCWVQETNSPISLLVLQNTQRLKEDACLPGGSLLGHPSNISCLLSPVSLPYVLWWMVSLQVLSSQPPYPKLSLFTSHFRVHLHPCLSVFYSDLLSKINMQVFFMTVNDWYHLKAHFLKDICSKTG